MARARRSQERKSPRKLGCLRAVVVSCLLGVALFYAIISASLFLLRWINPPFTAVQIQRRVSSWFQSESYTKRYQFVKLGNISPNLQHAVVAAEDARFYVHHGFDWNQIRLAAQEDLEEHRERGASTITQQLV